MAWTAPPVYTSGNVLTAAQMNAISGNFSETAPAKATTAGSLFVGTGANAIGERQFTHSPTSVVDTTSNTGYVELATHQNVTVTVGALALVAVSARLFVDTVNGIGFANFQVSSASTINADDDNALVVTSSTVNARQRSTALTILTAAAGLNAGSNVIKAVYKTTTGTLTAASRDLLVLPL